MQSFHPTYVVDSLKCEISKRPDNAPQFQLASHYRLVRESTLNADVFEIDHRLPLEARNPCRRAMSGSSFIKVRSEIAWDCPDPNAALCWPPPKAVRIWLYDTDGSYQFAIAWDISETGVTLDMITTFVRTNYENRATFAEVKAELFNTWILSDCERDALNVTGMRDYSSTSAPIFGDDGKIVGYGGTNDQLLRLGEMIKTSAYSEWVDLCSQVSEASILCDTQPQVATPKRGWQDAFTESGIFPDLTQTLTADTQLYLDPEILDQNLLLGTWWTDASNPVGQDLFHSTTPEISVSLSEEPAAKRWKGKARANAQ